MAESFSFAVHWEEMKECIAFLSVTSAVRLSEYPLHDKSPLKSRQNGPERSHFCYFPGVIGGKIRIGPQTQLLIIARS